MTFLILHDIKNFKKIINIARVSGDVMCVLCSGLFYF